MKLFHLLGFTKELVFGLSTSATRQTQLVSVCFLNGSLFFKEPAEIAYYAFEVFSRSCILLE